MDVLSVTRWTSSTHPLMVRLGATLLCFSFPSVSLQPVPTTGLTWLSGQATLGSFTSSGSIQAQLPLVRPQAGFSQLASSEPLRPVLLGWQQSPSASPQTHQNHTFSSRAAGARASPWALPKHSEMQTKSNTAATPSAPLWAGAAHLKSSPFLFQNVASALPPWSLALGPGLTLGASFAPGAQLSSHHSAQLLSLSAILELLGFLPPFSCTGAAGWDH